MFECPEESANNEVTLQHAVATSAASEQRLLAEGAILRAEIQRADGAAERGLVALQEPPPPPPSADPTFSAPPRPATDLATRMLVIRLVHVKTAGPRFGQRVSRIEAIEAQRMAPIALRSRLCLGWDRGARKLGAFPYHSCVVGADLMVFRKKPRYLQFSGVRPLRQ